MGMTRIAKVRLLSTPRQTDREYDYLCPGIVSVSRGNLVKIPFGKGDRTAFGIVERVVEETPTRPLKSILEVLPEEVGLTEELLSLCSYLKEHFFCTFGEAAKAMLPSPVYQKEAKKIGCIAPVPGVEPETALTGFKGKNKDTYQELLRYLSLSGEVPEKQCKELFRLDHSAFSLLEKKGLIRLFHKEEFRNPFLDLKQDPDPSPAVLSPAQQEAFRQIRDKIDEGKAAASLLHGITGSGKTQVILELCDYVLKQGKTVIFLVPEIALTGQSARLLYRRYGEKVALLHSALSEGERRDSYISIRKGEKPIVLGTRSAIFAPLSHLGLIVIDEEQDQSYKSDTQLKYHARDIARFRCAKADAHLLLASATPDIDSYYKAKEGKYTLVSLTERYGDAVLPQVRIVDLRKDLRTNPGILLGKTMREEIFANLERKEQTILLMNRRGYRRFVSCLDCGEVIRCPNCSVSMTLHNGSQKKLSCHYCGWQIPLPETCPQCSSEKLVPHGYGIQQLEEEIREVFPSADVLRLDSDSLNGKNSHEEILSAFRNKEADILIGTQMVAKGHNFPDVTLVGIVMADSALYLSDFRAAEHTFSLLTQVIGRAGRAEKKGRAIIQTLNPRHNVFFLAAQQDFETFYEGEIALRKAFQFPPFCQLALFTLSHEKETVLAQSAKTMGKHLEEHLKGDFSDVKWIVYGPFDSPIYRMKNIYRKRFIIKYKNNARSRALLATLLSEFSDGGSQSAKLALDIGPGMI